MGRRYRREITRWDSVTGRFAQADSSAAAAARLSAGAAVPRRLVVWAHRATELYLASAQLAVRPAAGAAVVVFREVRCVLLATSRIPVAYIRQASLYFCNGRVR